jgi:hypothetical protein
MARFVVLDPSLTCLGGHYYELAVRVLQAADRLGYEPVLATNKRFTQQDPLPPRWQVLPVFADDSFGYRVDYPLDADGMSLESPTAVVREGLRRLSLAGCCQVVFQSWRRRQRRRRLERFAAACAAIHASVGLRGGDHVFLPSTFLFDLLGLVRFLARTCGLSEVTWHGLFHRGFLQGREPEYAAQKAVERNVRRQLEYLSQNIPQGRLRLYGTSHKLADQFNRLSPLEFGVLPFPVDPLVFQSDERDGSPRRLRLMCAGFLRREKGKAFARHFVEGIWDHELASGRLQLVVQTNRRQARRIITHRTAVPLVFRSNLQRAGDVPIVWLRHPLPPDAYIDLIRKSDIAVFLHDGRAYYTQCSGVLVEMLAGGVPVLVPAGSWLADQIAESIYEHLDDLRSTASVIDSRQPGAREWRMSLPTDCVRASPVFGNAAAAAECDIDIPPATYAALVSFAWDTRTPPGTYVRVAVRRGGPGTGEDATSTVAVVGPRSIGKPVSTLVSLEGNATRIKLSLSNAYDDAWMSVSHVKIRLLGAPANGASTYPAGRVGLVFADVEQLPPLVRDMREHYPHYLESARTFAATWRHQHDARQVIERLLSGDGAQRRAVA